MKKFILIILSIIIAKTSFAQLSISQINSDSNVINFVKQQNLSKDAPQWNHFYLTDGTEWKDYANFNQQQIAQTAQLINNISWKKIDINNDGKEDLIVGGYISRAPEDWTTATFKLLVFLSVNKKDKYDEINLLNEDADKYPSYFNTINIQSKNYMQLFSWEKPNNSLQQFPFRTDTLQYNTLVQNFIDYTKSLYPSGIQKIEYNVKDDEQASYHNIVLEKKDDKYFIEFSIKQPDSKNIESHTLRIKETFFHSLDSLVRSYNLASDKIDIANDDNSDAQPITTTIYYRNGTKKNITDLDGASDYTLMAIYQAMEASMQTAINKINNRNEFWSELAGDMAGAVL